MLIIPAIDIRGGKCVRLRQRDAGDGSRRGEADVDKERVKRIIHRSRRFRRLRQIVDAERACVWPVQPQRILHSFSCFFSNLRNLCNPRIDSSSISW